MRFSILATMLAGLASAAHAAPTAADWRHDIDEIVRQVRIVHPNPFTKVGESVFLREAEAFKDALPTLSDEQRMARAMKLMTLIGDAHSIIEPATPEYSWWYPVRFAEFDDGYFITAAHKTEASLPGAQVLEIGGMPVARAMSLARDLVSTDNQFGRKEMLHAIHNAALMRGIAVAGADRSLRVKLRLPNGRIVNRVLQPMQNANAFDPFYASLDWRFPRTEIGGAPIAPLADWISAYKSLPSNAFATFDASRPPHLSQRSLLARPMPERDAYYIMINVWHGTDKESIPEFIARAMREVDQQKPKSLILDLRYAPGGDGSNGPSILQELLARKNNQPWKDFYILVSGRTYSASLNALAPIVQNVPATLIGEPMGGSFHLYGDYSTFKLPRTKTELRVSALSYVLNESSDIRAFIPVDVPATFTFADYAAGRDPAVDPILAGQEMRSIPLIAMAEGGAAARRVYLERKARFGSDPRWAPPTEPQLRLVGQTLLRANRTNDAMETFALSAEINPGEWRSWFNLGNAQKSAGQTAQALESFKRTLALNDPTNFNQSWLTGEVAKMEAELKAAGGAK